MHASHAHPDPVCDVGVDAGAGESCCGEKQGRAAAQPDQAQRSQGCKRSPQGWRSARDPSRSGLPAAGQRPRQAAVPEGQRGFVGQAQARALVGGVPDLQVGHALGRSAAGALREARPDAKVEATAQERASSTQGDPARRPQGGAGHQHHPLPRHRQGQPRAGPGARPAREGDRLAAQGARRAQRGSEEELRLPGHHAGGGRSHLRKRGGLLGRQGRLGLQDRGRRRLGRQRAAQWPRGQAFGVQRQPDVR